MAIFEFYSTTSYRSYFVSVFFFGSIEGRQVFIRAGGAVHKKSTSEPALVQSSKLLPLPGAGYRMALVSKVSEPHSSGAQLQ